jgi:hypothetical protein
MTKQTQGRRIIEQLKKRQMSSMQILMLGISTCWWKRVAESLQQDEVLSTVEIDGLKRYRVRAPGAR